MKTKTNLLIRWIFYLGGLFIVTVGIAFSVRSNLGVSPVSSIPYTLTCIFGLEMGKATMLFHAALVGLQMIMLNKAFKWKNLFQVPVGVMFGLFTTMSNSLLLFIPAPESMVMRLVFLAISIVLIAIGLFFYVPADFIPLAAEGTMLAVSHLTSIKFSTSKICFDVGVVIISLAACLIALHALGSVGVGTVIAAIFVGVVLKILIRFFGKHREAILSYGIIEHEMLE